MHTLQRGFTLMEVIVALVVIAILAAVALPLYNAYVTRARVVEALIFADAARTRVDLALMQGRMPDPAAINTKADMITGMQWVAAPAPAAGAAPGAKTLGFILVEMKLPGFGEAPVNAVALQRTDQGAWICTSAAKVSAPNTKALPLEEKYLPASCHGDGSALAALATTCPPGQDRVTLTTAGKSSNACTPPCGVGQTRDAANPTQCNSPAVAVTPPPVVTPTPPAATTPAPATKPPATTHTEPLQCHVCDPNAPPELCEQVTVETTCTYPKNYCMTEVNNHPDGTKDVRRYCGDFDEMHREWWEGTSDDDKCRAVDTTVLSLDFRCTFACEKPNCNQSGQLRPPTESLYSDK